MLAAHLPKTYILKSDFPATQGMLCHMQAGASCGDPTWWPSLGLDIVTSMQYLENPPVLRQRELDDPFARDIW